MSAAAVVVDPYSSGRFLLYELKARGLPIICVRSSLNVSPYFLKVYEAHRDYFVETLDFDDFAGDVQRLAEALRELPYKVAGVLAGSEPGVELADILAEALALPTANGTELLHARKDKAEMQERLRQCGVPAAEQFKSGDLSELLVWARARNQWPLVAKPTGGSGSDGVFFCQSEVDLTTAHAEIIGKVNPNGVLNSQIALQEFLAGDEYIVDTVSSNGRHLCVAIWVYKKRRGLPWNPTAILSSQNLLLSASGEEQDALVDYVFRVLDAVGLRYGPCHTEVMFTQRGPILVEVNARLHGLQGPRLIELATGTSKATYAADVFVGGGHMFEERYKAHQGRYLYPMLKNCVQLVLACPVTGYLSKSIKDRIDKLQLPSVVEVIPAAQVGQYLRQSCDLCTAAGFVLMVHESAKQLQDDIQRIRDAEEGGLVYYVSDEPVPGSPAASPRRSQTKLEEPGSPKLHSLEKADELCIDTEELPGPVEMGMTGLELEA